MPDIEVTGSRCTEVHPNPRMLPTPNRLGHAPAPLRPRHGRTALGRACLVCCLLPAGRSSWSSLLSRDVWRRPQQGLGEWDRVVTHNGCDQWKSDLWRRFRTTNMNREARPTHRDLAVDLGADVPDDLGRERQDASGPCFYDNLGQVEVLHSYRPQPRPACLEVHLAMDGDDVLRLRHFRTAHADDLSGAIVRSSLLYMSVSGRLRVGITVPRAVPPTRGCLACTTRARYVTGTTAPGGGTGMRGGSGKSEGDNSGVSKRRRISIRGARCTLRSGYSPPASGRVALSVRYAGLGAHLLGPTRQVTREEPKLVATSNREPRGGRSSSNLDLARDSYSVERREVRLIGDLRSRRLDSDGR